MYRKITQVSVQKMNSSGSTKSRGLAKGLFGCIFWSFSLLLAVGTVHAHRVWIYAWVEGATIHTESKFSGSRDVKNGKITVYDLEGTHLLDGQTDTLGKFSFKAPKDTGVRIVLDTGTGHRAEWTIPLKEIKEAEGGRPGSGVHVERYEGNPSESTGPPLSQPLNPEDIQLAVEKAVDKKLAPVIRMLAKSSNPAPSFTDILGGIGYIIGLVGVAAYFHYRRRNGGAPKP